MANVEEYEKSQEISFDIADLFSFLWQKKLPILITIALLVSGGFWYVKQLPKLYLASSTLLLDDKTSNVGLPGLAALTGGSPNKMDTHIQFIRSKKFIQEVVEKLALQTEPEFYPLRGPLAGKPDIEHTIEVVLEDLTLSHINGTDMLKVSFVSKTPRIAATIVDQIGPSFFAFQAEKNRERAEQASQWLNTQVDDIQAALTLSEQNLQQFFEQHQLVDLDSQIRLVQSEVSALMREQLINNKALGSLKYTTELTKKYQQDTPALLGIPWILNNPMVTDLRRKILEQEQVLTEISKRYKYKHHKYIAAKSTLDGLNKELTQLLKQLVLSLLQEYEILQAEETELAAKLSKAHEKLSAYGRLEIELTKLKRDLESNQKMYEAFLTRLQETELLKDMEQQSNYAVIDYATVPKRAYKPNVPLSMIVITLLSSLLSVGFWLVIHLLSDSRNRIRQILRRVDVSVLAEIPKRRKFKDGDTIAHLSDVKSQQFAFSEAIRSLRTAVLVNAPDKEIRVIAVSSASDKKSNSGLSIALADSLGRMDKTLLIEADLRTPTISKSFGLPKNHVGLTSLLSRQAKLSDCLHRSSHTPLTLLPAGPAPTDPLIYLTKTRFATFVKKLAIFYDRVVIDVPPINAFSDALVVAKSIDGIILECNLDNASVDSVLESIQRLHDAGAPLLGVVLTNVKSKRKYRKR